MPHLQFDINKKLNSKDKNKFCKYIRNNFGKIMKTGTDHVAISLRELGKDSLSLGRAKDNEYVCFMNLDVRVGRSVKQKRELVKSYIKTYKISAVISNCCNNHYSINPNHYFMKLSD